MFDTTLESADLSQPNLYVRDMPPDSWGCELNEPHDIWYRHSEGDVWICFRRTENSCVLIYGKAFQSLGDLSCFSYRPLNPGEVVKFTML